MAKQWDEQHPVVGPSHAADADRWPFGQLTLQGSRQTSDYGVSLHERLRVGAPHLLDVYKVHVRATNLTILNPNHDAPNTDGFDPDSCQVRRPEGDRK